MKWLDTILSENRKFQQKIDIDRLPTDREVCPYAVVTCMDPRVNLESVGALPFRSTGELQSQVRVIRTIGGVAEDRSLAIGIHLAGFKEIAVVMHTDCGCSVAYSKIDTLLTNMQTNLSSEKWEAFKQQIGEPLRENMIKWLHAFQDPQQAVRKEIEAIKQRSFIPDSIILHGLVYDLTTGSIKVVINGYNN